MPLLAHESGLTRSLVIRAFGVAQTSTIRESLHVRSAWSYRPLTTQSGLVARVPSPRKIHRQVQGHALSTTRPSCYRSTAGRGRHGDQDHVFTDEDGNSAGFGPEDGTPKVIAPFRPIPLDDKVQSEANAKSIDVFECQNHENEFAREAKEREMNEREGKEDGNSNDDELEFATWPQDQTSPAMRSRIQTYQRRLKQDNKDILELVDRKKSPRALRSLLRPSPSLHLEQSLSEANDPRLLPRPRPKSVHDLSYRNAKTLEVFNVNGCREPVVDDTVSLQSITAKYIREGIRPRAGSDGLGVFGSTPADFDTNLDRKLSPLTAAEHQTLQKAGYDEEDAQSWAKILLEPGIDLAARWLNAPGDIVSPSMSTGKATPWFVMNFLLRRENITAEALRLILDHAWRALTWQERIRKADASGKLQPTCPTMIMTLCVRLVRHARDVWPQALPNITKLFTAYILDARTQYLKAIGKPLSPSLLKDLTFKSNRMLSQLSLAGKTYPVLSAAHQQRAQFDLIRKMTQHQPALRINREGHRALTKTLLLLKKTPQERDWALLQARSWPPFKISQTRLDDPKDRKYGTSTAGKSIEFMRAYGYPMMYWDFIAQVYTGWNPDGSPSVQRRALTPAVPTSMAGEPDEGELQAAIITATRTVPEAWAAFLKFDSPDGKWRAIYIAMFKKLLMQESAQKRRPRPLVHPDNEPVLAGDGIEIFPAPSSPMEAIYLPSEPPTVAAFFETLLDRGFPIWGGLMCLLLEKTPSFEFGLRVWNTGKFLRIDASGRASWSTEHLSFLQSPFRSQLDTLPDVPGDLLTALISCVTAFPHTIADLALIDRDELRVGSWGLRADHTLTYAYRLLLYYKPPKAKAWNYLFKGLAQRTSFRYAISRRDRTREQFWPLVAWAMSSNVLKSMFAAGAFPDHMTFRYLCDIASEAAVIARLHSLEREDSRLEDADGQHDLEKEAVEAAFLMSQGSSVLRRQFARLVGLDKDRSRIEHDSHANMPNHLAIPKAAVLHKYVRALGILGDHEGIYSLTRWMVDAASDLHELQETQLNGRRHMRQLIVALRVWLEYPSRDFILSERGIRLEPAGEELVQLARQEVERVRRWGGWPSDAAVDTYCTRHPNYWE